MARLTVPGGAASVPVAPNPLPGVSVSGKTLVLKSAASVQWTVNPTFDETAPKFGTAALASGVGTLPFVVPTDSNGNANASFQFFLKAGETAAFTPGRNFLWVEDSAGQEFGVRRTGTTLSSDHAGSLIDLGYVVADGGVYHHYHWFIVGTLGDQHYSIWHRDGTEDGAGGNSDNGSHPGLKAGPATLHIDHDNGLARGDLLDAVWVRSGSDFATPTTSPVATDDSLALLNLDGNGLDDANTVTTTIGPVQLGYGLERDAAGKLAAPNIAPRVEYFNTPTDGSGLGSQVNAAIASIQRGHGQIIRIQPGFITADEPIRNPGRFAVIGMGVHEPNNFSFAGGGVLVQMPLNGKGGCLTAIGSKPNASTSEGFNYLPVFEKIACSGATQAWHARDAGGPARLVKLVNSYSPELWDISVHNDFHGGFYFENCWDWRMGRLRGNAPGFSDMNATADSAEIQSYTGRSFLAMENVAGRSLGVPMCEFYSPNTNGQDTDNNCRLDDFHFEGNAQNSVGLLIHGGNTNMLTFTGGKIELVDGNVPMIVVDGAMTGLRILSTWLHAGGNGYNSPTFGGAAYRDKANPGLLLCGNGVVSPQFDLTIGYQSGQAPLDAFLRFVGVENPIVQASLVQGQDMLPNGGKAPAMIFDNCGPVSKSRTQLWPWQYVVNQMKGADPSYTWQERAYINGSTEVA